MTSHDHYTSRTIDPNCALCMVASAFAPLGVETETIDQRRERIARAAYALASEGKSLFEIARTVGVSKEYLRERLGLR